MSVYRPRYFLGLALTLLFLLPAARLTDFKFLRQLEAISYDARLLVTLPQGIDSRIVIVDIDEKSLNEVGRWPWGRDRLGDLLDNLLDKYGASIVGFDVVFAEKDESSGLPVLEKLGAGRLKNVAQFQSALNELRPGLDHDRVFAQKLKDRPVVLGYYFSGGTKSFGTLPAPVFRAPDFAGKHIAFVTASGYGANLQAFQESAISGGHFIPQVDFDGITRRVPLLVKYQDNYYESLALAMARVLLGSPRIEAGFPGNNDSASYQGLEWLKLDGTRIPVDENVCALVPFRGYQGSFRYVAAADVLNGKADPNILAGAIVLVGTSAPGLMDLRATPVGAVYPGVEVHANLLAGILDGALKQKPVYVMGMEIITLLLAGCLLAYYLPRLSPAKATLLTLALLAVIIGANLTAWQRNNLILPLASPLLLVLTLYLLNMAYGFFVESRAKRELTGLFGQYVSPELVDEMTRHPEIAASMEGESRTMTVLFVDVRDFTRISEGLSAKVLSQLMNEYLTAMTEIIHKHRGSIDKYMGDAIMAFWGAPLNDPEHARHAVEAGMDMLAALPEVNARFRAKGWPEVRIGIGINTGIMNVGNMGSRFRRAYTVMGDAVNLGSRLEGLTKIYGVSMIAGGDTMHATSGFAWRELDCVKVKGKDHPVVIYEPLGLAAQASTRDMENAALFRQMLDCYRVCQWDEAEALLTKLEHEEQHPLYQLYRNRIAHFRTTPPGPEWGGVFVFNRK